MQVTYTGLVRLTYVDYMDLSTGKVLVCEPGGTYDVAPLNAAANYPPDGRFLVTAEKKQEDPDGGSSGESLPGQKEVCPDGKDL